VRENILPMPRRCRPYDSSVDGRLGWDRVLEPGGGAMRVLRVLRGALARIVRPLRYDPEPYGEDGRRPSGEDAARYGSLNDPPSF